MSTSDDTLDNPKILSETKRILLEERLKGKIGPVSKNKNRIEKRPGSASSIATLGQRRIWLLHQIDPKSPNYNISSSFYLAGPKLDLEVLEKSVNQVIFRHEILRSNYRLENEHLIQVVSGQFNLKIESFEVEANETLESVAESQIQKPFNMEVDPLVRLVFIRQAEGDDLLTFIAHHIIFDEWSLGIFWSEINAIYQQLVSGETDTHEELPIQFADFAFWQDKQYLSGVFSSQLDYWKQQLAAPPSPIALPTDRPFPTALTDLGRLERITISKKLTEQLRSFAQNEAVSMSTVLLFGFNLLLHFYSGAEDILVGVPIADRNRKETAPLIGFFLNTLCIRTDFSGDPTLVQGLEKVGRVFKEAVQNQNTPIENIVDAIGPERVEGRHQLFQTMFVYEREDYAASILNLGETVARSTFIESRRSKFDLTLFAVDSGEQLTSIMEYRTDIFDQGTVHRMLGHFEVLLTELVTFPGKAVSSLCALKDAESKSLKIGWQGPKVLFNDEPLLPGKIEEIAKINADLPALISIAGEVSYKALEHRVNRLAKYLANIGVSVGQPVGVFMHRSPDTIVAALAILRAGGAYLPIDPGYPEHRYCFMIEDAGVQWVITSESLNNQLSTIPNILPITEASIPVELEITNALPVVQPEWLAYIIYTSGSTGKPKGVRVSHENLRNSTYARSHYYSKGPERFLLIPGFSFDSSIAGMFWTLSCGGTLVIPDQVQDPELLGNLIEEHQVTTLLCVPSLYQQLLKWNKEKLESIESVIVAGESCSPALVKIHFESSPNCLLFNEYGPTEGTVWSTVYSCSIEDAAKTHVPIGRPIPNTTVFILDAYGRMLPSGIPGELCIGGNGVALGYWNREELTAERFVNTADLGRIYKTGDRAQWDAEGRIHFLGRIDEQVKIRGYRIETGEIESLLQSHSLIESAVVVPTAIIPHDIPDLTDEVCEDELKSLIERIEALSDSEIHHELESRGFIQNNQNETAYRISHREKFHLDFYLKSKGFIQPPRKEQRDWLLSQAMAEFSDDLEYLDEISKKFVTGFNRKVHEDIRNINEAKLTDFEIMEDWQLPLMQAMVDYATEAGGDILEVGFGRGGSAEMIQQKSINSHSIVESNDHSVEAYFNPWRSSHSDSDIRLFHGRWQDIEPELGLYDGIFFHTFPMDEDEFVEYVLKSITFAEHSFPAMSAHLKPGGVFTYLSTEIDSLSRRHQRLLLKHFSSICFHVVPLNIPEDTKDAWWAPTMVVIKVTK